MTTRDKTTAINSTREIMARAAILATLVSGSALEKIADSIMDEAAELLKKLEKLEVTSGR